MVEKLKKGSELPVASDIGLDDTLFGLQENVTKRFSAASLLALVPDGTYGINVKLVGAKGDGVTNDFAAVQAAVNAVSSSNGGFVYFPRGNYIITGLKVPGNVILIGSGAGATFLSYAGEPGAIGIEFTYRATSYNLGGFAMLTAYNIGSFGAAGVMTPANTDAFTRTQRWSFTDFASRGISGNAAHMLIGDAGSGMIQRFFIQGPYVAQNADAGQPVDEGILMKGARGVVNMDISAYKIRGVRTGIRASDFAEGFSIHDGEIVGSWEGIVCDSNPSKPGGFIDNNHLNCSYRGIRLERRRHITIGTNQYYRDASFFAHGLGWKAIQATSCASIVSGVVQTRPGVGFTDGNVGVSLTDTPDVQIEAISGGEAGTLNTAIQVAATAAGLAGGVTLKGISGETVTTWAEFTGAVNDFKLSDNVNERGTASATPITFIGTGAEKASIKLPRGSTALPEYQIFPNRNAALSKDIKARAHAPEFKESLVAGASAYAVNYYLDTVSAVTGDTFVLRLTQIGGSNSTLNIYSGASTGAPALLLGLAAAAAGTNQLRVFTIKFNGTAWEIVGNVASLT